MGGGEWKEWPGDMGSMVCAVGTRIPMSASLCWIWDLMIQISIESFLLKFLECYTIMVVVRS